MQLNFPPVEIKIEKEESGQSKIFDNTRKKWLVLTPEEWVRQHLIEYLVQELAYPRGLIAIEQGIKYNGLLKRFDALVYNLAGKPILLIECKQPKVAITEKVFHQIAMYNFELKVPYLLMTNGFQHIFGVIDAARKLKFSEEILPYTSL